MSHADVKGEEGGGGGEGGGEEGGELGCCCFCPQPWHPLSYKMPAVLLLTM